MTFAPAARPARPGPESEASRLSLLLWCLSMAIGAAPTTDRPAADVLDLACDYGRGRGVARADFAGLLVVTLGDVVARVGADYPPRRPRRRPGAGRLPRPGRRPGVTP